MKNRITRRLVISGATGAVAAPVFASARARGQRGGTADQSTPALAAAESLPFAQKERGATIRPLLDKVREVVSLADFANSDRERDATEALHNAVAALGPNGGTIEIPPGDWRVNAVILANNITLRGKGGAGEFGRACLRPFSLARPTLTFGNGLQDFRYCGLADLHVSGADGSAESNIRSALSAPQALLLNGGTINFTAFNCVFYNGVETVALVPSATNPVTVSKFIGCTIRNDLRDSAKARAIYSERRVSAGGYNTSNKFIAVKLNGPPMGYAAEFNGGRAGITVEINDSYWDVFPDHGLLLRGSSGLVCFNLQLDPGTLGAVVIETDDKGGDPARYISGIMRHGGQKMKFGNGVTVDLPEEADTFSYRARISSPFFSDLGYFAPKTMPYSTKVFYDFATDQGPMRWHGIQHRFMDTTDASEDLKQAALQSAGGLAVDKSIRSGSVISARSGYFVNGAQVIGSRKEAVRPASGGKVVDVEARRAIDDLLERLRAHGLIG